MARTAAHTQEQVFAAADQLAASGQEVTPNSLREVLGKGSYSTLGKHIEAWKQERKTAAAPVIIPMPDEVNAAFAACWHAAATEASKEIAAIREKADAEVKSTKRELEDALGEIVRLEEGADASADALETAQAALAQTTKDAQQAATDAAAREAGLSATVEQMRERIATQLEEIARGHRDAEAARTQHASEADRLRGQIAEAGEQLKAASAREAGLSATNEQMRQLVETQTNETARCHRDAEAAHAQHTAEADRLRGQIAEAERKIEAGNARERVKNEETATAKLEAAKTKDEADRLRAQLAQVGEQLKEQKLRSNEVIGRLEESKQKMETELSNARKETNDAGKQLARAQGQIETLHGQINNLTTTVRALSEHTEQKPEGAKKKP